MVKTFFYSFIITKILLSFAPSLPTRSTASFHNDHTHAREERHMPAKKPAASRSKGARVWRTTQKSAWRATQVPWGLFFRQQMRIKGSRVARRQRYLRRKTLTSVKLARSETTTTNQKLIPRILWIAVRNDRITKNKNYRQRNPRKTRPRGTSWNHKQNRIERTKDDHAQQLHAPKLTVLPRTSSPFPSEQRRPQKTERKKTTYRHRFVSE